MASRTLNTRWPRFGILIAAFALALPGGYAAQGGQVLTIHDYAARGDSANVARRLRAGRKIDRPSTRHGGRTPMMLAAEWGHGEVVELLLEAGARVDAMVEHGQTALHLAAFGGHDAVIELLLAAETPRTGSSLQRTTQDDRGCVALHYAALCVEPRAVELLLLAKGQPAPVDEFGWTPLHYAASSGELENGRVLARASSRIDAKTVGGSTASHLAARCGDVAMLKMLESEGADRDSKDFLGRTPRELLAGRVAVTQSEGRLPSEPRSSSPPSALMTTIDSPAEIFTSWNTYCPGPGPLPEGCDLAIWSDGVVLFSSERNKPNQRLRVALIPAEPLLLLWRELEECGVLTGSHGVSGPGSTVRTLRFRHAGQRHASGVSRNRWLGRRERNLDRFLIIRAHRLATDVLELAIPEHSWPFEEVQSEGRFRDYDPQDPNQWMRTWNSPR